MEGWREEDLNLFCRPQLRLAGLVHPLARALTESRLHGDVVILLGQALHGVHAAEVDAAASHRGEKVALFSFFRLLGLRTWESFFK